LSVLDVEESVKKSRLFVLPTLLLIGTVSLFAAQGVLQMREVGNEYIEAWKRFYPSRAFSHGFLGSIFYYENFSEAKIENWLKINRTILQKISKNGPEMDTEDRIDARLLEVQIKSEIDKWEKEAPQKNDLSLYSGAISRAAHGVVDSPLLMAAEKVRVLQKRLEGIGSLCAAAVDQLENGRPKSVERSLRSLGKSADFYESELPERVKMWIEPERFDEFSSHCRWTAEKIRDLVAYVNSDLVPGLTKTDRVVLGREEYARRLRLYTDSELTPEELAEMSMEEIQKVRGLIAQVCEEYLREAYPQQAIPENLNDRMKKALGDMEKNHPTGQHEYLRLWEELALKAEQFIRDKKIATLPENQTLSIRLAPEGAGPMARIGWVSPAPAFHPNPWTTIYLPNIPDSHPEMEKENFWRSFNNHFTTFIIIHELFPGHYIQSLINRENPHPVRILFPYGLYSEGWATLCEKVALDAGWDNHDKLTYLAHLRKRIENANRAYTSVQVHCNGWNREEVDKFSVDTSLLAPQFAKSLWGRLISSPMQITSYFLGTQQFTELYENERKRLGQSFKTIDFMDTVLRAGPIPLDEFPAIFKTR
jgi:uncharacterized protein (DUF885 family)